MKSSAVKITRKGQVTLPKEVRQTLSANTIYFEIEDGIVTVQPVRDAAGSLREFAGNVKSGASMKQMRDKAWKEALREKSAKKRS